jgi:tetratricopeptide (TPR) repeat protein
MGQLTEADAAYAAGRIDITLDLWERAHGEALLAGDSQAAAAAAVRVAMHLLFDTALMAPVRAWIRRAERLLPPDGATPAHAWLAVVRNYERMLSGDFEGAHRFARRAVEIGSRCDPSAAGVGRVAEARSLMLMGDITEGLALLDDAALAATSGELDPLSTGMVYCEVVCALQAAAQYDRAEEWTVAMEQWRHGRPVGSIHGRCRVHRAEILRLRGSCAEAEEEALAACEELRPYLRREFGWPLTELGRIRLRKGDIDGAEDAFRAAHEAGWDPEPGLALVHLARGDIAAAVRGIRSALEAPPGVPSKELPPNTELRRAPLLEALVEIELAAGEREGPRSAAVELARIAERFQSRALGAGAALARGRVLLADGKASEARHEFEAALVAWADIGAPYETAVARMGVARACRAEGDVERARVEFSAAHSGFERIGAERAAAEAQRESAERESAEGDVGAAVATEAVIPAGNIFRREGDFWRLAFEGRTALVRDLKGLHYLARLLAAPGREVHVLDLAAGAAGAPGMLADVMPGPLVDAQAREAYRRRLADIDEDIAEAAGLGDVDRMAQAESERDFLMHELARAVGLGGRARRTGSAAERARAGVTRATRKAMARIAEHHAQLGEHLERTIRTGTRCAYEPDPRAPAGWRV